MSPFATNPDASIYYTDGNVGIGTSSPTSLLHVKASNPGTNPFIETENDTGARTFLYTGRSGDVYADQTVLENDLGNAVLLNPLGGNVGIGTTSPQALLDLSGDLRVSNGLGEIRLSTDANGGVIRFFQGATEQATVRSDVVAGELRFEAGGDGVISATPSTKMVITATGNVGIGTTNPVSPGSYTRTVVVSGPVASLALESAVAGSTWEIGNQADGALAFGQGNTAAIVVHADGNVGVGTSAPQATLDINGTVRLSVYQAEPYGCNQARNGAIALTSRYTLCVCKLNLWVATSNGTTACDWEP